MMICYEVGKCIEWSEGDSSEFWDLLNEKD